MVKLGLFTANFVFRSMLPNPEAKTNKEYPLLERLKYCVEHNHEC
uniref:Uncharacterized protein n=1 Tax=Anguilla anguilla TaxID=7936 RepID=A0A0E9R1Z8_ANGAN